MKTLPTAARSCLILIWLAAACGQATPAPTAPAVTANPRTALVGELAGTVKGRPAPAEPLAPITLGFQLKSGGEVQTGEASKARLDFSDGTILRLAANSAFVLQSVAPAADGSLLGHVSLAFGKLWVTLFGGELEVETPVGVASVRGSYAVFSYQPGDPNNLDDDLLVVDCLEGSCGAQNDVVDEELGNLERVVLSRQASLRQTLTAQDVQNFLQENPESQALVATLTAAPPATARATRTSGPAATATPSPPPAAPSGTPTEAATAVGAVSPPAGPSATPGPTDTLVPVTLTPGFTIMGFHTVRVGETLYCLGRGYGVLPAAIAAANSLDPAAPLAIGLRLAIPAVAWTNIIPGPVCAPEFRSLFPGLPTATLTPIPATATVACPAGQFFDPALNQCRPVPVPATSTATPPASATPFVLLPTATPAPLPTSTFTPIPTITPSPTPTLDTSPPAMSNLAASPASLGYPNCSLTFSVDLNDPSGVDPQQVRANYTLNYFSTPTIGSAGLNLASGSVFAGTWTNAITITGAPGGYLNWEAQAADVLGNQATLPNPITVTISYCP